MLDGFIDPDDQGAVGLLLYSKGAEEHVWNTGDLLGHFSNHHDLWLK